MHAADADTALEALSERDRLRRAALERFWAAFKANRKDDRNVTWMRVLEAAKAVEATEKC